MLVDVEDYGSIALPPRHIDDGWFGTILVVLATPIAVLVSVVAVVIGLVWGSLAEMLA